MSFSVISLLAETVSGNGMNHEEDALTRLRPQPPENVKLPTEQLLPFHPERYKACRDLGLPCSEVSYLLHNNRGRQYLSLLRVSSSAF